MNEFTFVIKAFQLSTVFFQIINLLFLLIDYIIFLFVLGVQWYELRFQLLILLLQTFPLILCIAFIFRLPKVVPDRLFLFVGVKFEF